MFVVRHGESKFNKAFRETGVDPGIPDPPLTNIGIKQIQSSANYLLGSHVTKLLSSPYRRTLETSAILNQRFNLNIEINSLVREQFGFSCDIGSSRDALQKSWPFIDFSSLKQKWWPDKSESAEDVKNRTVPFFDALKTSPDFCSTLVISHWGVVRALAGISVGNGTIVKLSRLGAATIVHTPDL